MIYTSEEMECALHDLKARVQELEQVAHQAGEVIAESIRDMEPDIARAHKTYLKLCDVLRGEK